MGASQAMNRNEKQRGRLRRERAFRRQLTYHEAGHAVAARLLGVEIAAIDMTEGADYVANVQTRRAAYRAKAGDRTARAAAHYADLQVALAGEIAQQLAGYPPTSDDTALGSDFANATNSAAMLARLDAGLSDELGPDESRELSAGDPLHTAGCEIMERAYSETVALLRANWLAVVRVAAVLRKAKRLTQADIDHAINHGLRRRTTDMKPSPADIRRAIEMARLGTWVDPTDEEFRYWSCHLVEPDGNRFCNGHGVTAEDAMALAWLHRWAPDALHTAHVEDGAVPFEIPEGFGFDVSPPRAT